MTSKSALNRFDTIVMDAVDNLSHIIESSRHVNGVLHREVAVNDLLVSCNSFNIEENVWEMQKRSWNKLQVLSGR